MSKASSLSTTFDARLTKLQLDLMSNVDEQLKQTTKSIGEAHDQLGKRVEDSLA